MKGPNRNKLKNVHLLMKTD